MQLIKELIFTFSHIGNIGKVLVSYPSLLNLGRWNSKIIMYVWFAHNNKHVSINITRDMPLWQQYNIPDFVYDSITCGI